VLGRDLLERPGEPVEHVVGQAPLRAVSVSDVYVDPDRRMTVGQLGQGVHASLAIRIPAKIWRRWGWSQLRKVGVATRAQVAHEPPRSTRQSPPKKHLGVLAVGVRAEAGVALELLLVHSHVSPSIPRQPLGEAPSGWTVDGLCPEGELVEVRAFRGRGLGAPRVGREAPVSWSQVAAFSHSISVGRRIPCALAKASASNQ